MKATVVVDNRAACGMDGEWGLCFFIEYNGKKILLDAGASDLFLSNGKKMGIPVEQADFAVLSHAHYDHADGLRYFFRANDHAMCFLRESCGENCYKKKGWFQKEYIGISKGILSEFESRIRRVSGDYTLSPGVYLIPHKKAGLEKIGVRERMYRREGRRWIPDDFSHEQSLVFDTENGLVIFNSCSHGGADLIIREVGETFPDKKIAAMIGGFHLFNKTEAEVREFAGRVRETGIRKVYTGHCTGEAAFEILRQELGERVVQLGVGLVIEV